MKIIGIDPGLNHAGWAILEKLKDGSIKYINSGVVHTKPSDDITHRLATLFMSLDNIIIEHQPAIASIEQTFLNSNAKTSLILGFARGAILAAIGKNNLNTLEYAPNAIKKTIVGNGKASKDQVMKMLKYVIPNAIFKSEDEADAIAIAYCGLVYSSLPLHIKR